CRAEREQAITRLLDLLAKHGIPATWAIVGALFEDGADDLLHAPDLIEEIQRCPVPQEIGSHTFTHPVMTMVTREQAHRQFALAVESAAKAGVRPRTIIFPRNQIAHLDLAREYGFTCYRTPEPRWYCGAGERDPLSRLGHLADVLAATTPRSVEPVLDEFGMMAIPGSMLYTPSFGIRRHIPAALRVTRARRGLQEAIRNRNVFHLWFHPTDIVVNMNEMLAGLDQILHLVATYRDAGELEVQPMVGLRSALVRETETQASVCANQHLLARAGALS
ncbi:MAG: polysaccharide deacetylase family protein, partial [Acidobacteria bacterium]|nr:polysaccharide deacetylase family protein [Acidobacteriota bacterium]